MFVNSQRFYWILSLVTLLCLQLINLDFIQSNNSKAIPTNMLQYSISDLRSLGTKFNNTKPSEVVQETIRELGINRKTRRGTKAGQRKQRCIKVVCDNTELQSEKNVRKQYSKANTVNLNNLTPIPTEEKNMVSVCLLNSQSCRNKASDLHDLVIQNNIDILALTETWLSPGDKDNCVRSELTPDGYQLIDVPRGKGRGGGVGFLFKDSLIIKKQKVGVQIKSYECIEILMDGGSTFLRILLLYRPPSSEKSSVFFEEFGNHLDNMCTASGNLLIIGDFNFHLDQKR